MKEILGQIKTIAVERIGSPLIGSFVIALLCFNWQSAFVLLFSSQAIETRLIYIEHVYSSPRQHLFYPFLVSLGYAFVYPFVRSQIERLTCYFETWVTGYRFELEKYRIDKANELKLHEVNINKEGAGNDIELARRHIVSTAIGKIKSKVGELSAGKELDQNVREALIQLDSISKIDKPPPSPPLAGVK